MALRLAETLAMVRLVSLLVSLNVPRESTESIVDVFLANLVSILILTKQKMIFGLLLLINALCFLLDHLEVELRQYRSTSNQVQFDMFKNNRTMN